ncbi:uncharacterized protein [Palaemon carinicauda]|uniref:uncharacterized protein isoform X2 n=1 Tax=Palaemon carinicauda TaxID=392227 RepID=UPI0035B5926B
MDDNSDVLRLATYMCPSLPVEYYEFLAEYLESKLEKQTVLIYNSRLYAPDTKRGDQKYIDLAFISTSTYLDEYKRDSSIFKLLGVGAVTKHPVKGEVLGYYTDIVAHKDFKDRKDFMDLRGCKYVFANKNSLSSIQQVLLKLKQLGESVAFFNNIKASGNHMNSIEQVISKRAEVTAVDSLSLTNYLNRHYYQVSELFLFESWGPLPPHPIMINAKVSDEMKAKIESAFLDIHNTPHWKEKLANFGVSCFRPTSTDNYLDTMDLLDSTKSLTIEETYY